MKKLFVGNMDFHTTENELRTLVEPFGSIGSVHIATDRDTGRSRGFGFVEINEDDGAEKAIAAVHGTQLSGRALTVNEARPKTTDGRGGFGASGGSGRGRQPRW